MRKQRAHRSKFRNESLVQYVRWHFTASTHIGRRLSTPSTTWTTQVTSEARSKRIVRATSCDQSMTGDDPLSDVAENHWTYYQTKEIVFNIACMHAVSTSMALICCRTPVRVQQNREPAAGLQGLISTSAAMFEPAGNCTAAVSAGDLRATWQWMRPTKSPHNCYWCPAGWWCILLCANGCGYQRCLRIPLSHSLRAKRPIDSSVDSRSSVTVLFLYGYEKLTSKNLILHLRQR